MAETLANICKYTRIHEQNERFEKKKKIGLIKFRKPRVSETNLDYYQNQTSSKNILYYRIL